MADIPDTLTPIIERECERVMPNGIPARSPSVLTAGITHAALAGYQQGRADAIAELLTGPQVAAILGLNESRIRQIAIAHGLGWQVGRDRLYRPEDVERLRALPDRRRKEQLR